MNEIKERKNLVDLLEECQFTHWQTLLSYLGSLREHDVVNTQQIIESLDEINESTGLTWDIVIKGIEKCDPGFANTLQLYFGKEMLLYSVLHTLIEYLEKCFLQECPLLDELCTQVQFPNCYMLVSELGVDAHEMDKFRKENQEEKRRKIFSLWIAKQEPRQRVLDALVHKSVGGDSYAYEYKQYLRMKVVRGMTLVLILLR